MGPRGGELRVRPGLTIPAAELSVETARSGGPGGQNVNKVETKVRLRFDVAGSRALAPAARERLLERLASRLTRSGELVVEASRHREQARNEADARERLAALLAAALAPRRKRKKTRPTRASRERRLEAKRKRGSLKSERRPGRDERRREGE